MYYTCNNVYIKILYKRFNYLKKKKHVNKLNKFTKKAKKLK